MSESTTSFLFPDINVWLALTFDGHVHSQIAWDWLTNLSDQPRFVFCRFTQLGLLRLLSLDAVMGEDVMNQTQAWHAYDRWLADERVECLGEPAGLDDRFRSGTRLHHPAPKDWADSYLAAFAETAQVTLVTFDRGMKTKTKPIILIGA